MSSTIITTTMLGLEIPEEKLVTRTATGKVTCLGRPQHTFDNSQNFWLCPQCRCELKPLIRLEATELLEKLVPQSYRERGKDWVADFITETEGPDERNTALQLACFTARAPIYERTGKEATARWILGFVLTHQRGHEDKRDVTEMPWVQLRKYFDRLDNYNSETPGLDSPIQLYSQFYYS
jgi:hypothetical protein